MWAIGKTTLGWMDKDLFFLFERISPKISYPPFNCHPLPQSQKFFCSIIYHD